MQLKKLSPLAGLILAGLLSACGGGGGDEPPAPAAPPPPAITISAVTLKSSTPRAIAQTQLEFDGGVCGGGTGTLTASWNFGDGTGAGSSNTHTYAEAVTGLNTVTVTCTDTAGTTANLTTLDLNVESAAMRGFLGRTWTAYTSIDPANVSPYPVAGITSDGDVYGVWLRRVGTVKGVANSTTKFSSSSWTSPTAFTNAPPTTDESPFDDTQSGRHDAAIDMAVSPDGHAIAAWVTADPATPNIFTIRYTTKSKLSPSWTPPTKITVSNLINESIKVVVNDAGVSAIAYCTGTSDALGVTQTTSGAEIITDFALPNPVPISKKCGKAERDLSGDVLQRLRGFDIAIDSGSPTIYTVGVNAGTVDANKFVVTSKSIGSATVTAISEELATAPDYLSYSRSPNGKFAAIAWDQVTPARPKSNVYSRICAPSTGGPGCTWRAIQPVQDNFTTKDYSRPLVAINDTGDAFLAMQLKNPGLTTYKTEVSNYEAAATAPAWSMPFQTSNVSNSAETQFNATDIAIDKWGTGLVTFFDGYKSAAGTFAKKTGATQWVGFKTISPSYALPFRYQTMRALPDGRAILVTGVYDDITARTGTTSPILSGYTLLQ